MKTVLVVASQTFELEHVADRENVRFVKVAGGEGPRLASVAMDQVDGKKFDGPAQLGAAVASMPAATACVTNRMLGYALGRAPARNQVAGLEKSFAASGYRIPELMKLIATSASFTHVSPESAPTQSASAAN